MKLKVEGTIKGEGILLIPTIYLFKSKYELSISVGFLTASLDISYLRKQK